MRLLIITLLLVVGAHYAHNQHIAEALEDFQVSRDQADTCYKLDVGAYNCLTRLYGSTQVGKCIQFLDQRSTNSDDNETFSRCLAEPQLPETNVWIYITDTIWSG